MEEKKKNDRGQVEGYELASVWSRFIANLLDGILLAFTLSIFLAAMTLAEARNPLFQFIMMAVPIAYHWYFWTRRAGQTPGKFAMGIRVIKADGGAISDVDAVIRAIGYQVSAMFFGLGFIWAFFDKNNQSWHDKLARTYVVRKDGQRKIVNIG